VQGTVFHRETSSAKAPLEELQSKVSGFGIWDLGSRGFRTGLGLRVWGLGLEGWRSGVGDLRKGGCDLGSGVYTLGVSGAGSG